MTINKPWLKEKKWADNRINSAAKLQHYVLWAFALIWSLVSAPILFQFEELWSKTLREPVTGIAFLFPLIGVVLIVMAIRSTQNWLKFGRTPLALDPFPGSLGGHVGGVIDTTIAFDSALTGSVTLQCIESYVSGTGKDRSRKEKTKWQTDGACHVQRGPQGTSFRFRFDVPDELPESDLDKGKRYHLWRVTVASKLEGPDFSRRYEIPVFKTSEKSISLIEGTEDHHVTVDEAIAGVESIANIRTIAGGLQAYFPAFQRPGMGVFTLLFGAIFAGAGIGAGYGGAPIIFPIVFVTVGALIGLFGVYYLAKSLQIQITGDGVKCRRFVFGYPLSSKSIAAADIAQLSIKDGATMNTGNKSTVFYQLIAESRDGLKLTVAERLTSRAEVELLKQSFETYLNLNSYP